MVQKNLLEKIDFAGDSYKVKQSLIRNKYEVMDENGNKILGAKQKLFKMKEEFPFTNPNGEVVFRIKADKRMDIAGDYRLIDEKSGDTVAILSKKFSLFKHVWKLKDPTSGEEYSSIESRGRIVGFLRFLSDIFSLFPHKYTIYNGKEKEIGEIKGKFSLKDTYNVQLYDLGEVPREPLIAAAVTIDALEGN